MKNLLLVLLLLVGLGFNEASAQMGKVQTAITYLTDYHAGQDVKDLIKAKDAITLAEGHEKSMNVSKTWYYKGQIYAAMSGLQENPELSEGASLAAYEAYQKTVELEKNEKRKKHTKDAMNGLFLLSPSFYNEGYAFFEKNKYEEAYGNFAKVLEINEMAAQSSKDAGGTIDTNAVLAAAYAADRGGLKPEAKKHYTQLMDMNYEDAAIFQSLARIYREDGDAAKADEILAKGREMFPDNSALIIDEINRLLSEGKDEEAVSQMEEAIKLDPENATLYFAMGAAFDKKGDAEQAIKNYQKSIDLKPDYFDANYNLGAVYYNQAAEKTKEASTLDLNDQANYDRLKGESDELFKKALPFFEKALALNGEDRNNLIALKEIYARLNMFDKAKEIGDKLK